MLHHHTMEQGPSDIEVLQVLYTTLLEFSIYLSIYEYSVGFITLLKPLSNNARRLSKHLVK